MFRKKTTKELVRGGAAPDMETEEQPVAVEKLTVTKIKREKKSKQPHQSKDPEKQPRLKKNPDGRPFIKTRAFLGIVCIVLGLSVAFLGLPMLQMSVSKTQDVVCFAEDVKAGTKITESLLASVEMSGYHLPSGVLRDQQSAVGEYVTTDALAGDLVTASRLSKSYPGADPQLASLPAGKVAISISLKDLASSVSGKLREGDVIQLFAVEDDSTLTATAPQELQYVEVLAATYSDGADVKDDGKKTADSIDSGSSKETLATVTLLCNQQQAAVLAGLEHNATLHAALVVRGNDTAKEQALKTQDAYFAADSGSAAEGGK